MSAWDTWALLAYLTKAAQAYSKHLTFLTGDKKVCTWTKKSVPGQKSLYLYKRVRTNQGATVCLRGAEVLHRPVKSIVGRGR